MSTPIIPPTKVTSPRLHWSLITVLEDDKDGVALAIGRWDDDPVLAIRWNGTDENPIGNPQSRGLPTWFILPKWSYDGFLAILPPDKRKLARTFIPE